MNSKELAKKIRHCKKCPLHKSRKHAVSARTDGRNCNVLFIGEAQAQMKIEKENHS